MSKIIKFPEKNIVYRHHLESELKRQFFEKEARAQRRESEHTFFSFLGYCLGMFVGGLILPVFMLIGLFLIMLIFGR